MPEAFYEKTKDGFIATELTRGPWDPGAQHAGPPSALLGREIERVEGGDEFQVARVTFEILRPVPIGPVRVEAEVVRPGRSVQMIEASLSGEEGELIRARGWRIRTGEIEIPEDVVSSPEAPAGPEEGDKPEFFSTGQSVGYHTAMEWRSVGGGFLEPGPVHLERMPVGEWVCVDAVTLPQPSGVGTAESVLYDERGRIGRAAQALLIAERD
jgi:Thioesterase-like superfamily